MKACGRHYHTACAAACPLTHWAGGKARFRWGPLTAALAQHQVGSHWPPHASEEECQDTHGVQDWRVLHRFSAALDVVRTPLSPPLRARTALHTARFSLYMSTCTWRILLYPFLFICIGCEQLTAARRATMASMLHIGTRSQTQSASFFCDVSSGSPLMWQSSLPGWALKSPVADRYQSSNRQHISSRGPWMGTLVYNQGQRHRKKHEKMVQCLGVRKWCNVFHIKLPLSLLEPYGRQALSRLPSPLS